VPALTDDVATPAPPLPTNRPPSQIRPPSKNRTLSEKNRALSDDTREAAGRRRRLEIHVDQQREILVVTPVGEIDIVTGGLFLEALIAAVSAGESRLVVDLSRVPFMDSTGLAIFVSAHRALRTVDGQLRIVARPPIAAMFEFAWMDKFFPLHADVASAVAAFGVPVVPAPTPATDRS
jgi:anti-sigma B factor antagonist